MGSPPSGVSCKAGDIFQVVIQGVENEDISYKVRFFSLESVPVEITSIALTGSDTVASGRSIALKAEILPASATNKSLTWVSSDPSVAAVSSAGKVTGITAGTATITATAKDGSGISAAKDVTVTTATDRVAFKKEGLDLFFRAFNAYRLKSFLPIQPDPRGIIRQIHNY